MQTCVNILRKKHYASISFTSSETEDVWAIIGVILMLFSFI